MAASPVLFVYYPPLNDDSYPGVPNRHITEADWSTFTFQQRRTVENATTQEGYTRRKVWVHRDLVDETEQERADREAAEAAARAAFDRANSLVRYGQIESMIEQLEVLPPAEEFAALRQDVDAVADVPPRVEAVETAVQRIDPGTAGSENQALRRGPQGPVWADDIINVKAAGAKGDGTTDDTAVLQGLIDQHTTDNGGKGAVLYFPPGVYMANLTVRSGIVLSSQTNVMGRHMTAVRHVTIRGVTTAPVIDTPTSAVYCIGMIGVNVEGARADGTYAGTSTIGVRLRNVNRSLFRQMHIAGFQRQGMTTAEGGSNMYEDLLLTSCLRERSATAIRGAFELGGTDHFVDGVEAGASLQNDLNNVSSPSLFLVGVYITCNNGFFHRVYGELSDRGVVVAGERNRFTNCRADMNFGHDWDVTSHDNLFEACHAIHGGMGATNTYDGFLVSGRRNTFTGCRVLRRDTTTLYRYAFNDSVSVTTVSLRNQYMNCWGTQWATRMWNTASAWAGAAPAFPPNQIRPTGNPATIDVSMVSLISLGGYNAATTITNFTNATNGQEITLIGDPDVTIANNDTIKTATGADLTLAANRAYRFAFFDGVWYQVGA